MPARSAARPIARPVACSAARLPARPTPRRRERRTAFVRVLLLVLPLMLGGVSPCLSLPPVEQAPAVNATAPPAPPAPPFSGGEPAGTPAPEADLFLLERTAVPAERAPSPEVSRLWENWRAMLARHTAPQVFGPATSPLPGPILAQWKNVAARMPAMPPAEKLRIINGFFNNWSSLTDSANYGQEEYWAAPEEFLANGGGDCEDYALIKYLALRYFGWPAQDLWIVFLRDRINNGNHAVLAARADGRVFILDNLSRPAYLLIPEKQYAKQVTPLYALNELGLWVFARDARPEKGTADAPDRKAGGKKTGRAAK